MDKNSILFKREEFEYILDDLFQFGLCDIELFKSAKDNLEKKIKYFNSGISINEINYLINHTEEKYEKALLQRIVLVSDTLHLHTDHRVSNTYYLSDALKWDMIYNSLLFMNNGKIISSIGSQGFLSIILYRHESLDGGIDILRLHIWHKSLEKYINKAILSKFMIHSHLFSSQSWILCGEIYNTTYDVEKDQKETELSFYSIRWDKSTFDGKDNNRRSRLANTFKPAVISREVKESYKAGLTYQIKAGEFHSTEVNDGYDITSTLFLFSTRKGKTDKSFVLGPKELTEAPSYEYLPFDCTYLLNNINENITNGNK